MIANISEGMVSPVKGFWPVSITLPVVVGLDSTTRAMPESSA